MFVPVDDRLELVYADGTVPAPRKPRAQPFRLPQGVDVKVWFRVVRPNGVAQNITGWTIRFTMKEDTDDQVEIVGPRDAIVTDALGGLGYFPIGPSDTVTQITPEILPASGPYVGGVRATLPGPDVAELLPPTPIQLGPLVDEPGSTPTPPPVSAGLIVTGAIQARVRSSSNVALTGLQTVNGVALDADDSVLLVGQTDPIENGVWLAKLGAWVRPLVFGTGLHASGVMVFVRSGTVNADTLWVITTDPPSDVIDTHPLAFLNITGAGNGLPSFLGQDKAVVKEVGNPTPAAVFARLNLDEILAAFTISTFTPGFTLDKEIGDTIANPQFTAAYNRPAAAATLQDETDTQAIAPSPFTAFGYGAPASTFVARSYMKTVINAQHVWTLSANEASGPTKQATVTASWRPRVFHGIAPIPVAFDEAFIEGLASSALASGFTRTINFPSAGGTQRLYYALPSAFGSPAQFKDAVSGLPVPFSMIIAAVPVTNAFGVTVNYDVWESDNFLVVAVGVVIS